MRKLASGRRNGRTSGRQRRVDSASGRWQARYRVEGERIAATTTFRTKRDAEAYLATVRADMERGPWINPSAGRITLHEYATTWLEQRPNIRPRTREGYESQLRRHIFPVLGDTELAKITPRQVRAWNSAMVRSDTTGRTTAAKYYRLLRTILSTAVMDELLVKDPCVINGAGVEKTPGRPVATIDQVYEIAGAIEPRYRALVLTATFTGLRLGELRALTRERADLLHGRIKVVEQYQNLRNGTLLLCPPTSDAGVQTVAIPAIFTPELEAHLATSTRPSPRCHPILLRSRAGMRTGPVLTAQVLAAHPQAHYYAEKLAVPIDPLVETGIRPRIIDLVRVPATSHSPGTSNRCPEADQNHVRRTVHCDGLRGSHAEGHARLRVLVGLRRWENIEALLACFARATFDQ